MRVLFGLGLAALISTPTVSAEMPQWVAQKTSDGDYAFVARREGAELLRFGCLVKDKVFFVLVRGLPAARSGQIAFGEFVVTLEGPRGEVSGGRPAATADLDAIQAAAEITITSADDRMTLAPPPRQKVSEMIESCRELIQ